MGERFYSDNWEERLEQLSFENNDWMEKAYVCSPLHAETREEYLRNVHAARAYMLYAQQRLGYLARAPHAYLPMILCDNDPKERELALRFGLELLEQSKVMLVCGNRMSKGMIGEIVQATALNKKIIVYNEELCHEVRKLVVTNQGHRSYVMLDQTHPLMMVPAPQESF